jgi:spermidine/putrescine transport system substrate-binding protein
MYFTVFDIKKTSQKGRVRILAWLLALSLSALAQAEELRILCWEGYASPAYTEKFEKLVKEKYAIEVTLKVTNVSDPEEFFSQVSRRQTDLISPAHNIPKASRWRLIERALVLPVELANVPNYQHIIKELQNADYITENGLVYGVPIVYGPYGLMYNTQLVEKAPESWSVFWEPQYAGRYAISQDYHEANIYVTALALGFDHEQIYDYRALKQDPRFMPRLAQLAYYSKKFWVGVDSADVLQGLALATGWGFAIPELAKRGEVWKMAQPKEGTTGWVDNWMIGHSLKDNPQMKRIAEEWINFSISPEIQLGYVRNIAQFPVSLAIKPLLSDTEIVQFHLDDPEYFRNNLVLWKVLSMEDQAGFKQMWKQVDRATERVSP